MKDRDLEESPAYQLWLATNAYHRQLRRALEPFGLTHVQLTILGLTRRLSVHGPVMQADVCRVGSMDANMASEVVRSLEKKGLLERLPHPTDRRAFHLTLTSTGAELLGQARLAVRPVMEAFFAPLGEDRKELARMLRVLARSERREQ